MDFQQQIVRDTLKKFGVNILQNENFNQVASENFRHLFNEIDPNILLSLNIESSAIMNISQLLLLSSIIDTILKDQKFIKRTQNEKLLSFDFLPQSKLIKLNEDISEDLYSIDKFIHKSNFVSQNSFSTNNQDAESVFNSLKDEIVFNESLLRDINQQKLHIEQQLNLKQGELGKLKAQYQSMINIIPSYVNKLERQENINKSLGEIYIKKYQNLCFFKQNINF